MKKLTLLAALMAVFVVSALALDVPNIGFGISTTNSGVTPSWAIVSARSANQGAPAVYSISANSDLAGSAISTYKVTAQCVARYATNATTTLSVNQTNGFASGTVIVIQHVLTDNYEKRILTTMTAATNLITTVAPQEAVVPGDVIYAMSTTGAPSIRWGALTNTINGGGGPIIVGQKAKPLLLEINGTTLLGLTTVSGLYLPTNN